MSDDEVHKAITARRGSPFLNTGQAAQYIGLSPRTLEKMRTFGYGPKYRKHGRYVRYLITDLDEWSSAQARLSTTEQRPSTH
jgi:predicted DNA-binding transcriptional regulator AlpA